METIKIQLMNTKKIKLLLGLLLTAGFIHAQGVLNGDFEAWSNKIVYYSPRDMNTGNLECLVRGFDQLAVTIMDAASGNSAILLKSQIAGKDSAFGYMLYGLPEENGVSGGIPYTDKPASFTVSLKYNTPGSADVIVLLMFKKNGLPISNQVFEIMGNQPAWKDTTFMISSLPDTPDTVIFGVAAANPFTHQFHPGNWIAVDNIRFNGVAQQLPNNDLEMWNNLDSEEPDGWNTFNALYFLEQKPANVTKSTDAHSGNYSISVKTSVLNFLGGVFDTFGIVTTGRINEKGYSGGFPMKAKPDSVTYYYRYNNSNNIQDLALVYVQFSKYDLINKKTIVVDSGLSLLPASFQWKRVKIAFNPSSPVPDTCNIIIASSSLIFSPGGVGNQIIVDDMLFYYNGVGIPAQELIRPKLVIYPNPAQDKINVTLLADEYSELANWKIISADGKVYSGFRNLQKKDIQSVTLDISELPAGVYFLMNEETHATGMFTKQ